jgi:hypothetical protein
VEQEKFDDFHDIVLGQTGVKGGTPERGGTGACGMETTRYAAMDGRAIVGSARMLERDTRATCGRRTSGLKSLELT